MGVVSFQTTGSMKRSTRCMLFIITMIITSTTMTDEIMVTRIPVFVSYDDGMAAMTRTV